MTNTTDEWLWTDWNGGECPLADGVEFKMKLRDLKVRHGGMKAPTWRWSHVSKTHPYDIVAYAIRNPNYVAPVPVDYPALLKMAWQSLEVLTNAADCMAETYNSSMCEDELKEARTTLEAIRKVGVK